VSLNDVFKLTSYPVLYEVVKVLQAYFMDIFGTCLNIAIFDRLRKTRIEVLACGLIWDFP